VTGAEKAFLWITDRLEEHKIPYQVVGGLAARAYGVERPLADIDIDMSFEGAEDFFTAIRPPLPDHPDHIVTEEWDLIYYTFQYDGQVIDLSDIRHTFMRDRKNNRWHKHEADFSKSVPMVIFGKTVPVIPKNALIGYKKILNRDVDIADMVALEKTT
jgi:hypothetical protein